MKVRMKVWLEDNDQPVFGEGRRRLLEAICRYGSINRAAKELGQPYRKAWSSLTAWRVDWDSSCWSVALAVIVVAEAA